MGHSRIDEIWARLAVQDAINELFLATDAKAWERVRATFAAEVHFDMTSLAGGEPTTMTPDAIATPGPTAWVQSRRCTIRPVTTSYRWTGMVRRRAATASCYGTATHYKPQEEMRLTYLVGSYDFHLTRTPSGWKIDSFRFNKKYVE